MRKFFLALCAWFLVTNLFNTCQAKFIKYIPCEKLYDYILENEQGGNNNHTVYLNKDSNGTNFLLIRTNCVYEDGYGYQVTTPGNTKSPEDAVADILAYHIRRGTFGNNRIDYVNLYIPNSKHIKKKVFDVYGVRTVILDLPDPFYYAYISGRFFVADHQFTADEARRFVNGL